MPAQTHFNELSEFYRAIQALIDHLKNDGHIGDAQKLDSLLRTAWADGSEFLAETMLTLNDLRGDYSPSLDSEITRCFGFARHYRRMMVELGS